MTKQTKTCPPAAKPLGVWIDELKADRDKWRARAERAEGALRRIAEASDHYGMEFNAYNQGAETLAYAHKSTCILARAALAQTDAEPGPTLADAYRAEQTDE